MESTDCKLARLRVAMDFKVKIALKSCAQCGRRRFYEMNKCSTLVHLITSWIECSPMIHVQPLARLPRGGLSAPIRTSQSGSLPVSRPLAKNNAVLMRRFDSHSKRSLRLWIKADLA